MDQSSTGASHHPDRPANRLAGETSPYLLQHAHNPVDWYPWGPEALQRARSENRPIFLSIGYSACHWCHVMERESFENPDIAADDERALHQHQGRPRGAAGPGPDLHERRPGDDRPRRLAHVGVPHARRSSRSSAAPTFPPTDSRGMPGFPRLLLSVHRAWEERRDEILGSAAQMTERLRTMGEVAAGSEGSLELRHLDQAAKVLMRSFDSRHGGFGQAPKFPHPMDLKVLLRHHARTGDEQALHAAGLTLEKMARGGIYDHLGGGFARYSTDDRWLVPHFEKMLYDNALLASVYIEAFQVTGDQAFAQVARETLDYVLRRMTGLEGGFYSTEDADSEGEEGKYYVWTLDEIQQILGPDRGKTFAYVYDVSESGNWEGRNILNLPQPDQPGGEAALARRGRAERRAGRGSGEAAGRA